MENPTKLPSVIPNTWDPRDHQWHKLAMASEPFDWKIGYDVESKIATKLNQPGFRTNSKDQHSSGSCGGQALSYYVENKEALRNSFYTIHSAKDPYSQIFQPGGGVMPRDIPNLACKKGVCQEQLIPSNSIDGDCTESFMEQRKQTPITINDATMNKGLSYASVKLNFDTMAQAVRDNDGMIITVGGQDNGTWRTEFPNPPVEEIWAHFLYVGKVKLINGKKFIGVHNSWGDACGNHGWQWLGENYLPHISNAYVIYDPVNPILTPIDQQKLSLLQQILNLTYTLLGRLGYLTKKALGV